MWCRHLSVGMRFEGDFLMVLFGGFLIGRSGFEVG